MRCYFLIDGHIAGIEMMTGLSDRDAVTKARLLFSERMIPFDVGSNPLCLQASQSPVRRDT